MIVVSNTSPLINLAAIGQFDLLRQMYQTIRIPTAVYNEVVVRGSGKPGAADVQSATWISVQAVTTTAPVTRLNPQLNPGEREAIALALEQQADLVLIDEAVARQVAVTLQLPVSGVLGLLLSAKQQQRIRAVKPLLDDLRSQAGFWIAEPLYQQVVHMAGEHI
jgi:uncharacterized protein